MADHVTSLDSGIYAPHLEAIEETMQKYNAFLFVRPTEYDSTVLIGAGFATKSMDIHDKSSNWGPMAGMVPCDPYFSKKMLGNQPNPDIHPEPHGQAVPTHLTLSSLLVQKLVNKKMFKVTTPTWEVAGGRVSKTWFRPAPGADFYTASGIKATPVVFCIQQSRVYWVKWSDEKTQKSGVLVPLYVWAYDIEGERKPVTGDYDIWMVAAHASQFSQHMISRLAADPHGESAASIFTQNLIAQLNAACKRSAPRTCKVFNHGAEAQNYAFTQALDEKPLAMFTPAGTSRTVTIWQMAHILTDMQTMGYMGIYNKRYTELDARLMGGSTIKEFSRLEATQKEIAKRTSADYIAKLTPAQRWENFNAVNTLQGDEAKQRKQLIGGAAKRVVLRGRFREALQELRTWDERRPEPDPYWRKDLPRQDAAGNPLHGSPQARQFARANWRVATAAAREGYESARITRLYDEITKWAKITEAIVFDLQSLKAEDFPPGVRRLGDLARRLLGELNTFAIQSATGAGESAKLESGRPPFQTKLSAEQFLEALAEFDSPTPPPPAAP